MNNDTGDWLSAEQAVLPDGTQRENLPLINKKLPSLSDTPAGETPATGEGAGAPAAKP